MPKTNRDFLYALFHKMTDNDQGKLIQISFEQQFLPMFPVQKLEEIISDDKFDEMLAQAERELPAFTRYLLNHQPKTAPPTFGKNN